ncbi:hypothetical protein RYX36_017103 [Vicia faba]
MELFFYAVFGGLAAIVAVLELSKNNKDRINTSSAFNSFKNNYLLIYSLIVLMDMERGILDNSLLLALGLQCCLEQLWDLWLINRKAIFLGNGLVAIFSGLFGNVLVDTLALGPVAPFDAAAGFLTIGMIIILSTWTENYGDASENKSLLAQFKGVAVAIASDEK